MNSAIVLLDYDLPLPGKHATVTLGFRVEGEFFHEVTDITCYNHIFAKG